jgi:DNA-binding transcriptional LysR family regulator
MLAGLRRGELDAALVIEPRVDARDGLIFERLRADEVRLAVAPDHRLARRQSVKLAEAAVEPFVVFSRTEYPEHYDGIALLLGKHASRMRVAEECDSGMSLVAAIEAGDGVSVVSTAVGRAIGGRLRLLTLTPRPPPSVVGLAYADAKPTPLLARLIAVARRMAKAKRPAG